MDRIENALERLARREISARQAIAQLRAEGEDPYFAWETVFIVLGGSDLITTDETGRPRYSPSHRLVRDVKREMRR